MKSCNSCDYHIREHSSDVCIGCVYNEFCPGHKDNWKASSNESMVNNAYRERRTQPGETTNNPLGSPVKPPDKPVVEGQIIPDYYRQYRIMPDRFAMENNLPFWMACVIKYIMRAGFKKYEGKSPKDSEITDIKKAIRYLTERLEYIESTSFDSPGES